MADTFDKDSLKIDPLRLDREWLKQPSLYFDISSQLTEKRRKVKDLKRSQDLLAVELDKKIRDKPLKYGISQKLTETLIKATIQGRISYRALSDQIAEAEYEADVLQVAVAALDQKRSALDGMTRLHGQGYFSAQTVKRDEERPAKRSVGKSIKDLLDD